MGRRVRDSPAKVLLDPEQAIERATEFGKYQFFLLVTLLWGNIIDTSNIVFMVFGGSDATTCLAQTSIPIRNASTGVVMSNFTNCTQEKFIFASMLDSPGYASMSTYVLALQTSVQLSGALFGALLGGFLSDRIGRRYNTWMWLAAEVALGSASALMPSWESQMGIRFLIGFATGGYDSSVIILLMEWANARTRLKMQNALMCINSVAFVWFAFLAYLTRELGWRWLAVISNLQGLPSVLAFFFILETPRFLMLKGRTDEAILVLKKVSAWNGHSGDLDGDYAWEAHREKVAAEEASHQRATVHSIDPHASSLSYMSKWSYFDLFRSKQLVIRVLMVAYSFFVCGLVGYVFVFNVGNLFGNIFLNFGIMGTVNVGAALLLSGLDHKLHLGRRVVHQVSMIGVLVFIVAMIAYYLAGVDDAYQPLLVTFAMIGSMFSFPLWTVCGLYSGELFPTELRNKSSGIGTMTSILGGILSPIVLTLFVKDDPSTYSTPFIIVASTVVVNVVLAWFLLPETRGKLTEQKEIDEADAVSQMSH